jgi:hypothetical protein
MGLASGAHPATIVIQLFMPPRVVNRRIIGNLAPENRFLSGVRPKPDLPGRDQKSPPQFSSKFRLRRA